MASSSDWLVFLFVHGMVFGFLWLLTRPLVGLENYEPPPFDEEEFAKSQKKVNLDDYWDEGEIDYDTGEISSNSRPTARHPKNADRAYSGSAERFHDGGR